MTVRNIMITPSALIRQTDGLSYAIRIMRKNALSTVYVVDEKLRLLGILSISEAVRALRENLELSQVLYTNLRTTTPDMLISDIMPIAAESPYPIAVVDESQQLKGIVTKASVLSALL